MKMDKHGGEIGVPQCSSVVCGICQKLILAKHNQNR